MGFWGKGKPRSFVGKGLEVKGWAERFWAMPQLSGLETGRFYFHRFLVQLISTDFDKWTQHIPLRQ